MCSSEVTCLPANCSLSELALFFKFHLSVLRSSTKGLSLSHINGSYSHHDMAKNALLLLKLKTKWDSSSTLLWVVLWNLKPYWENFEVRYKSKDWKAK
jgi:hypothetical protein